MNISLALVLCTVFVTLAVWHFWMAMVPRSGEPVAVPTVDGKPLFAPSRRATVAVGLVLLLFALLVVATARVVPLGLPAAALVWPSYALAAGLLARAVGEFKYLGFFKRVRGSKFATLDSFVYSPLCLLLAIGVALVALNSTT